MKIYTVGGWCRDMLMHKEPKDRDYVVVGATPEQMVSLGFEQVGADFHQDIADAFFEAYNYDFVAFRKRAKELEVWHPVMENANPARIQQL